MHLHTPFFGCRLAGRPGGPHVAAPHACRRSLRPSPSSRAPHGRPHASSRAGVQERAPRGRGEAQPTPTGADSPVWAPLCGRYALNQLRALPEEQLKFELRLRGLPTVGRRAQLAGRLYTALAEENMVWGDGEGDSEEHGPGTDGGEACPLSGLQRSPTGMSVRNNLDFITTNATGAQVVFLWGQSAPNGIRVATSAVFRGKRSTWMFDCGEDTQRNLLKSRVIAWNRIDRFFVSSLSCEAVLGLPGMLCTVGMGREKGHETADMPVHIYGPPGLVDFLNVMLSVSRTYLEMPVIIHELTTRALEPGAPEGPRLVNRRSRLYAAQVPPDQLNPQGYHDGEIRTMLTRHRRKRQGGGMDERAGIQPMELPGPGDPTRTDLRLSDLTWTIRVDPEFVVQAAPLHNQRPCFGYAVREADKAGRLDAEAAVALGVPRGPAMSQLKAGQPVQAADGSTVYPEQVVGRPRRGRRWAFVGPCLDTISFVRGVGGSCDLLVQSMEPPAAPGASAAEVAAAQRDAAALAGRTAAALGAQELILWQPSALFLNTPAASDPAHPERVLREAEREFGSRSVSFAGSYAVHHLPPEGWEG